jgi:catechol 2,3-dioxygenase-like lactoylglutathione lyase family enzyme
VVRPTVLTESSPIAFLATTDAARAREFYDQRLGLRLVADEEFALVFDLAGTTLRIAKVETLEPAGHTVLGWQVDDVAKVVRSLADCGVPCERFPGMDQDELGVWLSQGGAAVAWFKDPDGNLLSVTQLPV